MRFFVIGVGVIFFRFWETALSFHRSKLCIQKILVRNALFAKKCVFINKYEISLRFILIILMCLYVCFRVHSFFKFRAAFRFVRNDRYVWQPIAAFVRFLISGVVRVLQSA